LGGASGGGTNTWWPAPVPVYPDSVIQLYIILVSPSDVYADIDSPFKVLSRC
jgi:hypothetical protein